MYFYNIWYDVLCTGGVLKLLFDLMIVFNIYFFFVDIGLWFLIWFILVNFGKGRFLGSGGGISYELKYCFMLFK